MRSGLQVLRVLGRKCPASGKPHVRGAYTCGRLPMQKAGHIRSQIWRRAAPSISQSRNVAFGSPNLRFIHPEVVRNLVPNRVPGELLVAPLAERNGGAINSVAETRGASAQVR